MLLYNIKKEVDIMRAKTHDPLSYIRGLQQLLVSDKKRIGFLFGAGTSLAKKNENSITIPAIGKMTEKILTELYKSSKYEEAIDEIRVEITEANFNIETFLSNLESKIHILAKGKLNGLTKTDFEELLADTKKEIIKIVSVHDQIVQFDNIENHIHVDFAEWIGRSNRKYPVEIFTTNYDFMFELGLENKSIPYYDGFTGSLEPFFNSESIERLDFLPTQTKLWKIHGSLGWKMDKNKKVVRKEPSEKDILIYPSILKYNNSRKQPYIALLDRLSNFIKQPDTILIVAGYSFGDEHINERILTALKANNLAHIFVFYYDKISHDKNNEFLLKEDSFLTRLALENSQLSVYGCRTGIIGSQFGKWKLKEKKSDFNSNSDNYFEEDEPHATGLQSEAGETTKNIWTGEGELKLVDFRNFTLFLQNMISHFGSELNDE